MRSELEDLASGFSDHTPSLSDWLGIERGPLALAFTDIVGSTIMALRLGDRTWIALLMEHFKKARFYKNRYSGFEVKLIGDACMVAFRTADAALEFATAFISDTGDPRIKIRVGIHVGDVRVVESDIYGVMVNYTFRVQSAMKGSGIALSNAAKENIVHEFGHSLLKRFSMSELEHEPLKGFPPNQQRLWQITPKPESISKVPGEPGV